MLRWLKKRKARAANDQFNRAVPEILARYGELLEKYPACYVDETWLPVSKGMMKEALKRGWLLAKGNEQLREHVKVGWTLLSTFQKGVGSKPLDTADLSDPLTAEGMATLNRIVDFGKLSQAEMDSDRDEMQEFIRQQSQPRT